VRQTPRQRARRPGGFQPPHCPNPQCAFHKPHPDWHFVRRGSHRRRRDDRRIQDYRCAHCRRTFSAPTFATTYRLQRPDLLRPVAQLLTEGAGLRQAARVLGTSHQTVARHLQRLGRHGLLFHWQRLEALPLPEDLVVDGFATFAYSQYHPFHANLAVGAESWMIYYLTDAPLRRSGRMTPAQKHTRAALEARDGRPDPKAVEKSMVGLLKPLVRRVPAGRTLVLYSDDHPAYRRALRRLRREEGTCPPIAHHVTPSTVRRTQHNPLFPVNLADLLLRHGSANHRRETIAFSKRRWAALIRMAVFVVWRNYIKKRREKESWPTATAAMWAGVVDRAWTWRQVLQRRIFPQHVALPPEWKGYYQGRLAYEGCGA
jgi:transposase-like protein